MLKYGSSLLRNSTARITSSLPTTTAASSRYVTARSLLSPLRRSNNSNLLILPSIHSRTAIAAPRPGGPALLERRSDRELPEVSTGDHSYLLHIPLFIITMIASASLIFNYQRSSSSVVSSTLYALRVHPTAHELLGNDISFRSKVPWISGKMDQLHGKIEISYKVKGSKGEATLHFRSYRRQRQGTFKTEEWAITLPNGEKVNLMDGGELHPSVDE